LAASVNALGFQTLSGQSAYVKLGFQIFQVKRKIQDISI
jgi:hypothetical protein